MTIDGRRYRKRAEAGQHLLDRLRREAASQLGYRQRTLNAGELGGFPLTAAISRTTTDQVQVTLAFDGAPGAQATLTEADLSAADPTGLITRLEHRLTRLEATRTETAASIERARTEQAHATASLGQPFPQAAALTAARERTRHIDEQLETAATARDQRDDAVVIAGHSAPTRNDAGSARNLPAHRSVEGAPPVGGRHHVPRDGRCAEGREAGQ